MDDFECVDLILNDFIKDIKQQCGMDEFYLIFKNGRTYASPEPRGFDCFKINSSDNIDKFHILTHFQLKGIHDIFPQSVITSCMLRYMES